MTQTFPDLPFFLPEMFYLSFFPGIFVENGIRCANECHEPMRNSRREKHPLKIPDHGKLRLQVARRVGLRFKLGVNT